MAKKNRKSGKNKKKGGGVRAKKRPTKSETEEAPTLVTETKTDVANATEAPPSGSASLAARADDNELVHAGVEARRLEPAAVDGQHRRPLPRSRQRPRSEARGVLLLRLQRLVLHRHHGQSALLLRALPLHQKVYLTGALVVGVNQVRGPDRHGGARLVVIQGVADVDGVLVVLGGSYALNL